MSEWGEKLNWPWWFPRTSASLETLGWFTVCWLIQEQAEWCELTAITELCWMANIPLEQMMFHKDCLKEEVMGLKYKLEAVPSKLLTLRFESQTLSWAVLKNCTFRKRISLPCWLCNISFLSTLDYFKQPALIIDRNPQSECSISS